MPRMIQRLAIDAALASLLLLVACGDVTSPDPAGGDKRSDTPVLARIDSHWLGSGLPPVATPSTADELVAAFVEAHDTQDPELLDRLLDEDYLFLRADGDVYTRTVDLSLTTKMMVGRAGQDGLRIAAMQTEYLQPVGTWSSVSAADPYFGGVAGAMSRPYSARLAYTVDGQSLILFVEGLVIFYAVPDGDEYRLLGLLDMTYGRPSRTESVSWSELKALFE